MQVASFDAIGTHWDIQVRTPLSDADWSVVLERITKRIETFDKAYSRFRPDSLVTQMSRGAGRYELPADGYTLLHFYHQLYVLSAGKVTPLIGQTMADAGYDAQYSLQTQKLQSPDAWNDVISFNKQEIILAKPALLDFGAAGKGYLVDIVGDILKQAGLSSYVINAGGDILHRANDGEAIDVGLENPNDTSEAIGVVKLLNNSLCASAGSKRKWGSFHHIIDPEQLGSPQQILATWVIAADTMTADGLATALFFTEAAKLRRSFDFSFAILQPDMNLYCSQDFPATLFTEANS